MIYKASIWQYRRPPRTDELEHYASPYYDPVKAHEYYMRTRVLKGRQRTYAGLSEAEAKQADAIKEQISEEKSRHYDNLQKKASDDAGNSKAAIQREIATLRAKYMGMSKEERAHNKTGTQREIERLRKLIRRERTKINRLLGRDLSEVEKEYNDRYHEAIDSIRSNSETSSKSKQHAPVSSKTAEKKNELPRTSGGGKRLLMTK